MSVQSPVPRRRTGIGRIGPGATLPAMRSCLVALLLLACGGEPETPPDVAELERAGQDPALLCALLAHHPGTASATEATARLTRLETEGRAALERDLSPRGLDATLARALLATHEGDPCAPRASVSVRLEPDGSSAWASPATNALSRAIGGAPAEPLRSAALSELSARVEALIGQAPVDGGRVGLELVLRVVPTGTVVGADGAVHPTFDLAPQLRVTRGIAGATPIELAVEHTDGAVLRDASASVDQGITTLLAQLTAAAPRSVTRGLRIAAIDQTLASVPAVLRIDGVVLRDGCGGRLPVPTGEARIDAVTGTMEALGRSYDVALATDGSGALIAEGATAPPNACAGSPVFELWILERAESGAYAGTLTTSTSLAPECVRCSATFAVTATP